MAAKRHLIPQSAMSITIKRLEDELGTCLFERSGNKVYLNDKGKKFYIHAKACIEEFHCAQKVVINNEKPTGEIRLLVQEERRTVANAITEFHKKYPLVRFTVCHNSYEKPTLSFDIMITDIKNNGKQVVSLPFLSENLMLAVPIEHPLSKEMAVSIAQLKDESFVMMPQENRLRHLTEALCRQNGFVPRKTIMCDDPFYIFKYISSGFGLALIPAHSWEGMWDDSITLIPIIGSSIERTTFIECTKSGLSQLPIRLFFEYLLSMADL